MGEDGRRARTSADRTGPTLLAVSAGVVGRAEEGTLAVAGGEYAEKAREIYDELKANEPEEYVCPYELATIPIGLGDFDTAFDEMDSASDIPAPVV